MQKTSPDKFNSEKLKLKCIRNREKGGGMVGRNPLYKSLSYPKRRITKDKLYILQTFSYLVNRQTTISMKMQYKFNDFVNNLKKYNRYMQTDLISHQRSFLLRKHKRAIT